jgi:hypothetical protein
MWFEPHGPLTEPVNKKWPMDRFLESSFAMAQPGIANVFVEMGHEYIRCHEWIDETHIPEYATGWFDVRPKSVSASTEAIPKWHREFHDHLNQVINTRASQAENHITEAIKNGRLADLILKQAGDTSGFEADTLRRIGQWHPSTPWQEPGYEVEHDQDTLDECQREHDEAVDHYRDLGQAIALSFPDIASLGALTLGWLDYQHKDTSYGSRDAWMVDSFNPANQSQVRAYFAFLLYRFCTTSSDSSSSEDVGMGHGKALQIMVAEVLAGSCRPDNLVREYSRLSRLIAKLRKQDSQIEEIEVWRRQIQYRHQLAGKGQYLYCGEMVPKSKPEPFLNEMFRQARSLNHMTKYFVQKSSDFKYLAGKASRAEDQIRTKLNISDEYATIDGKSYDE